MVEINGARVHLTGKEYQPLELLALRKGMTLTKEMFLSHLYGGMDEPEMKIIDVFICKLRKKLANASGGKNYIETVWRRGYVMREQGRLRRRPDKLPLFIIKKTAAPEPPAGWLDLLGLNRLMAKWRSLSGRVTSRWADELAPTSFPRRQTTL